MGARVDGTKYHYAPRSAIKSEVLADFVAEWMEMQTPPAKIGHETGIMYFDGSVMKEGASVGLVFILPLGVHMEYMVRLHFPASNKTCTARRRRSSSKWTCNRLRARHPAFASREARGTKEARRASRRQFTRAARRHNPPTRAERRSGSVGGENPST
jgi:hypothetical protein